MPNDKRHADEQGNQGRDNRAVDKRRVRQNCPLIGFHSRPVRKPKPKSRMESIE